MAYQLVAYRVCGSLQAANDIHVVTSQLSTGASLYSGAVAQVLTDMFGQKSFRDTTHQDHELTSAQKPRSFKSFQEAAVSRLYGGIHYAFDNNDGLQSGECIASRILDRVNFKK
jgi:hypothetical protein